MTKKKGYVEWSKWSAAISWGKEHASFRHRAPSTYRDNKRDVTGHKLQQAGAQMTHWSVQSCTSAGPRNFYMCSHHTKSVRLSLAQRIHNLCNITGKGILQIDKTGTFWMQYSIFAANTLQVFLSFMAALHSLIFLFVFFPRLWAQPQFCPLIE